MLKSTKSKERIVNTMKLQIEANNRIFGIEIYVDRLKNKFKKIFKTLLTIIGTLSLCLLCSIEVNKDLSLGMTILIYSTLWALFIIGVLAIDNK